MMNIAIIEDEETASDLLVSFLHRFGEESGQDFKVRVFNSASLFLYRYQPLFDIVFMDIELPNMNGMEAAQRLRGIDKDVVLVFVTNMAQFAVKGYEVNAFDYIVKPVTYPSFALKLGRVITHLAQKGGKKISVHVDDGVMCFDIDEIKYVEIFQHHLIYHTQDKDFHSHGTLKKIASYFPPNSFAKCNSCYLVNLRFVTSVKGYRLFLGKEILQISHPKRHDFLHALNAYYGGCL